MKRTSLIALALAVAISARADFSYNTDMKGAAGSQIAKYWFKGDKMMIESPNNCYVLDFGAQTATRINRAEKTYSVRKFSDMAHDIGPVGDVQVDMKETGEKKVINGFNASQVLLTMSTSMAARSGSTMQMKMEMEIWVSTDVPGAEELHAFYRRNADKFPWSAMVQGGNASMQKAMADMQRKMTSLNGVPVLQIIHIKPGGDAAQAAQMQQGLAQARARLEEMAKQPGQQGDFARQALARMGAAPAGGGLMDMTMESQNFSTASIPDSNFAVPAGYKEVQDMH